MASDGKPRAARALELAPLETAAQLAPAVELFGRVFGPPLPGVIEMRASLLAGGLCAGAFDPAAEGRPLVGAVWALAGWDAEGPFQHSHLAAVDPDVQGLGVGTALKRFHAEWCRARGIGRIRWTFDPLMAGNARFNLNRLGAVGDRWIEDCYGTLTGPLDPAGRTGEAVPSDRMGVCWDLRPDRGAPAGETTRVVLPPAGRGGLSVAEALARLRAELRPLLDRGGRAVGLERSAAGDHYRVVLPPEA